MKTPNPRCTGTSSQTGKPCRRYAITGGTVCPSHGGSAPQVIQKARERLEQAAPNAAGTLQNALGAVDEEGQPTAVAVRAAKEILDRVGLAPTKKLHHSGDIGGGGSSLVDAARTNPRARAALTELIDSLAYDEDEEGPSGEPSE